MNIIAFDTTCASSTVAILSDGATVSEISVDSSASHSQTILPIIDQAISSANMSIEDFKFVACSVGPGSFTGIRIGIATAKGLALPTKLKIIPVPTLLALAYNVSDRDSIICPIIDARRGQVYFSLFRWLNKEIAPLYNDACFLFDQVLELVSSLNQKIIFVGDAVPLYADQILKAGFSMADESAWQPRGASVAIASTHLLRFNPYITILPFEPIYLKLAQAERELLEKLGGDNLGN